MKKNLLTIMLILAVTALFAQDKPMKNAHDGSSVSYTPTIHPRATAKDFTVTFTSGASANLFTTLTAGNTVLIDLFFTT
jgi:hypothetical protein